VVTNILSVCFARVWVNVVRQADLEATCLDQTEIKTATPAEKGYRPEDLFHELDSLQGHARPLELGMDQEGLL
jgi:hypothetical protein